MSSSNVKVCVRLRPLIVDENTTTSSLKSLPITISEGNKVLITKSQHTKEFHFDSVFEDDKSNEIIYEKTIAPLIQSCLRGFNGTVFAYGQSGSGKTYTMMGSHDSYEDKKTSAAAGEEKGIIPRALSQIFNALSDDTSLTSSKVMASFVEIYNDDLVDLLSSQLATNIISMREDTENRLQITGMTELPLTSLDDALAVLERGNSLRRTAETHLNINSSRSHAIFTLNMEIISSEKKKNGAVLYSKLHLVDLAGSERMKKTGIVGALRRKESVGINQGLMSLGSVLNVLCNDVCIILLECCSLGRVIRCLVDKEKTASGHIPYRESKLTRFLQDSLGNNAALTFMVHIVV